MSNIEGNNKEVKKLSVKNDYIFKRIFARKGNEEYLVDFLSSLLKIEIQNIKVGHDIMLEKNLKEEKYGVLDVKAILNNKIEINIEIQLKNYANMIERANFYSAKMLSSQLKKGEKYVSIKPVIVIAILNFNYFKFEEYITESVIVAEKHRDVVIDKMQKYYYIELPKFRKSKLDKEDKVSQWLTFIDSENEKRIEEVMEKNDKIKKANKDLEYLSGNKAARRLAELRDSGMREMASAKHYGYITGKEEGISQRNVEIVKSMLKEKASIDFISKVTGLSKEEIEKLK